ncbi:MAG: DUF1761 domain-containing protein [Fluviicola sp.]|nr:DUF1761 domain-containing protein [Fluviicola sp.]
MEPNIHINFLAIGIAVVANFFLGFIWYTPLFGKVWAKEMGFNFDQKPPTSVFVKAMIINVIGNFLMAWVLAHNIAVWNPATWNQPASEMMTPALMAAMSAVFTWLGFFVPLDLNTVSWEMKSWKLFLINTTYHLLSLLVVSFIIVFMA